MLARQMTEWPGRINLSGHSLCMGDILQDTLAVFMAKMNKELEKKGNPLLTTATEMFVPKKFTSGLVAVDAALGGGFAGNQWVEVYGKESNGKTSIILNTIAANQALDPNFTTFWLASEHYDRDWSAQNGVDNDRVIVYPTNNMELAYQLVLDAAFSHEFDCIVLDSYPALSASEELEKTMDQNSMTLGARRTGQFFRKIGGTYSKDRPYVGFFVNQLRDAVGTFSSYGTPTTTPGGKAKNYAFYQRMEVRRSEWIEEKHEGIKDQVKVGQVNKYLMEKNKAGSPKTTASADFYFRDSLSGFNAGEFDTVKDIITMAVATKVVKRAGAWFKYTDLDGNDYAWNGRNPMVEEIRSNLSLQAEISAATLDLATAKD